MAMEQRRKRVLVAGGGITGLSAGYYVQKHAVEQGLSIEVTVIEQSERWGGKIRTLHRDGFVIERGPDSFLARKLPIIELTLDLGMEEELRATNPQASKTYIVSRGQLHPMPQGLVLGIPTQWKPFWNTGLLSPIAKLRAALDYVIPKGQASADESLGDFLERRLGREVLQSIVEPLLAGIYAGDTHRLSLQATFPQFKEAEQAYGSLIKGTKMSRKKQQGSGVQSANQAKISNRIPEAVRNSMFLTYQNGLSSLIERLLESLENEQTILRTDCELQNITRNDVTTEERYTVVYKDGTEESYDAIISTLPSYVTARLLQSQSEVLKLQEMPYVSVSNVIMAFRTEDIEHQLDGSGFLVPRSEKRFITACTWTSRKWLHTAPEGYELLRCYIGRSGDEEWQQLSDEELVRGVREELKTLIGLTSEPLFYEVTRLPDSMPQYPVGHLQQLERARQQLEEQMPGIVITGAGFHGVGIPDCIRQGKEAAVQMVQWLKTQS